MNDEIKQYLNAYLGDLRYWLAFLMTQYNDTSTKENEA